MSQLSCRRLIVVAALELRDDLRNPLLWLSVLGLALMVASLNGDALIPSGDPSPGGARAIINSQYALAQLFALASPFYGFLAATLAGFAVIRDDEHRVSPLLHSTPMTAAEYVWGKFAGVVTALGLVLLLHVSLTVVFFQLLPIADAEQLRGPFRLGNYVVPALAFTAPFVLLCAGLCFAIGERTRKALLVLAVPVTLFVLSIFVLWRWAPAWLDPRLDRLLIAFDASGLRWLNQTQFRLDRGVTFYNSWPVAFDPLFGVSRLLALASAVLAVATSVPSVRRRIPGAQGRQRSACSVVPDPATIRNRLTDPRDAAAPAITELQARSGRRQWQHGLFAIVWGELRELGRHPACYLIILLVMLSVWEYTATATGSLGAAMIPTAGGIAVGALERISILICLALLFFTVESLQRDATTRFEPLLLSTPIPTTVYLVAKAVANLLLVAALLITCAATALLLLALDPVAEIELWPLLLVWGLLLGPSFLFWGAFVTVAWAVTRSRYASYAVGLGAIALSVYLRSRDSMTWLWDWSLWGTLRWTDMAAFDLDARALLWNRSLTAAIALLLFGVAGRLFARPVRDRLRSSSRRLRSLFAAGWQLSPVLLLVVALGSVLAVEIERGFQNGDAERRRREYWRENVESWRDEALATLRHADLEIVLEPSDRRFEVAGSYRMVNETEEPLRRLPFTIGQAFEEVTWRVDHEPIAADDRDGLHVLPLDRPLAPGDSVDVAFDYRAVLPRGITRNGGGLPEFVLPSGIALGTLGPDFLPLPGFIDRIGPPRAERPRPRISTPDAPRASLPPIALALGPFTSRMVVTAPADYRVNSVGTEVSNRTTDGTTTVVWQSDHPVRALNLVAGRWAVRRSSGTAVYFHPDHDHNVEIISDTLVAARDRYSEWFHPYPWRELKLSQLPNYRDNAQGFPTNIVFPERMGFLTRADGRVDLAFVVTAHEVAHQWWGNLLVPAEAPGADLLIEGMAHYSTLLLHEAQRGAEARIAFSRQLEEEYTSRRRLDSERPLATMETETASDEAVVYDKGAWVLWMLHRQMGADRMFEGLRRFVKRHLRSPDHPTVDDLIATLRPLAPDAQAFDAFVEQWLFDVVLPEFRIREATAVPSGDQWLLTATLENVGTGSVTVEVAALPSEAEPGPPSSGASVRLGAGELRQVRWRADFEPREVIVDPEALVLQLNRNRARVVL